MNDHARNQVDRVTAALERAGSRIVAATAAAASEISSLRAELSAKRGAVEAATWKASELERRNETLIAEVRELKTELAKQSENSGKHATIVAEVEGVLRQREQDLVNLDAILTDVRKVMGESDAPR